MHKADWANCMNQRGDWCLGNKDLLTIPAQGDIVSNAVCRTGAAVRRSAAPESCLRCQTAKQTAATGVKEFVFKKRIIFFLKMTQNRRLSVSKLDIWIKCRNLMILLYQFQKRNFDRSQTDTSFSSDRLKLTGFWKRFPPQPVACSKCHADRHENYNL